MSAAKKIILLLWFIVASLATASALTPGSTETRAWEKSFAPLESRQAEPQQTLELRQANATCAYEFAPESLLATKTIPTPRLPGPTVDPLTGQPVGRFIGNQSGPAMIELAGGRTVAAGKGGVDTHTLYPNGANYQRLNPVGHPTNPTPHAHGHAPGTGPYMRGQGPSLDTSGNIVPWDSLGAHWPFP